MRGGITAALLLLGSGSALGEDILSQMKANIRFTNGLIQNIGTAGGSSLTVGGVNLGLSYFLTPAIAFSAGYEFNVDYARQTAPLSSVDAAVRYYLSGQGTRSVERSIGMVSTRRDQLAIYSGVELSHLSYVPVGLTQSVGMITMAGVLGFDRRVSSQVDLTGELNVAVFSFAVSDPRYRLRSITARIGFSFLF